MGELRHEHKQQKKTVLFRITRIALYVLFAEGLAPGVACRLLRLPGSRAGNGELGTSRFARSYFIPRTSTRPVTRVVIGELAYLGLRLLVYLRVWCVVVAPRTVLRQGPLGFAGG